MIFEPPPTQEPRFWLLVEDRGEVIAKYDGTDPFFTCRLAPEGLKGRFAWAWHALFGRMELRTTVTADPPLVSEVMAIDPIEATKKWIESSQDPEAAAKLVAVITDKREGG